ncbi:MAG TPA: hypothetical protein VFA29_09025, partial [Candidatus Baltobacteraceae bacterium]|nr:hypothetical protein [Candidatus Baltobacteraceae bacterium]
VNAFFSTELHDVVQGPYGKRYGPEIAPRLPGAMSGLVDAVVLDNLVEMHVPRGIEGPRRR